MLVKWKDVFSQSNFFTDIFIWLGWKLAQGLKFLCDAAQTLVDEMYKLLDFTSYAGLSNIFTTSEIRILLGVLFAFAFIVFGFTLITQNDKEKPKVLHNLLIAVMIITALPTGMTMLNDLTLDAKDAILGTQSKLSEQMIADNVVDLLYLDKQGFNNYTVKDGKVSGGKVNGFQGANAANISYIDATEKITEKYKKDLNSPDYFFNKITVNDDGTIKSEELKSDKFLGIELTNFFYRYNVDYLVIYISLAATAIAFFFVAFKVAKLIFELAVHGIIAPLFAAADLTSGQRTKQIMQSVGSIYVVLMIAVLMIKMYYLGSAYISATFSNGLVKAFALVFFALAVIDGPNIIEKVLGVDVGLKSGFQSMATLFMASRLVTSSVGTAAKAGAAAAGMAAGVVGGAKDAVNNFKSELENTKNNKSEGKAENHNSENSSAENNLYGDKKVDSNSQSNTESQNNNLRDNNEGAETPGATDDNSLSESNGLSEDEVAENLNAAESIPNSVPNETPTDNLGADSTTNINDNLDNSNLQNSSVQDMAKENGFNIPENFNGNITIDNSTNRISQPISNPNGILGTAQRTYNSTRSIGGTLGKKAGQAARKRADKKLADSIKGDNE